MKQYVVVFFPQGEVTSASITCHRLWGLRSTTTDYELHHRDSLRTREIHAQFFINTVVHRLYKSPRNSGVHLGCNWKKTGISIKGPQRCWIQDSDCSEGVNSHALVALCHSWWCYRVNKERECVFSYVLNAIYRLLGLKTREGLTGSQLKTIRKNKMCRLLKTGESKLTQCVVAVKKKKTRSWTKQFRNEKWNPRG